MSRESTANPWATSPKTPRNSSKVPPLIKSASSKENEVIVIDDDSDNETAHHNGLDNRRGSASGSDTVERQLVGMEVDASGIRTPTTNNEPPTSPSVSPKGFGLNSPGKPTKTPIKTPIALPTSLPVPSPRHQQSPESKKSHPPPLFSTTPLHGYSGPSGQQHLFNSYTPTKDSLPPPLNPGLPNSLPPSSQPQLSQNSLPSLSQATGVPASQASHPTASQAPLSQAKKPDSPKPPPKPIQQPTVRLEFFVDDPEEYEVDILSMAKSSGQRLPTPPPVRDEGESSGGSDDDDDEPKGSGAPGGTGGDVTTGMFAPGSILAMAASGELVDAPPPPEAPKRRKRRNRDYDLDDPFINDTELAIDERKYVAQTVLQGFYVSIGDLTLVESDPPANAHSHSSIQGQHMGKYASNMSNLAPYGGSVAGGLAGGVGGTMGIMTGIGIEGKRGPGRPPKSKVGPVNAVLIAKAILSKPLGKKGDEECAPASILQAAQALELAAAQGENPASVGGMSTDDALMSRMLGNQVSTDSTEEGEESAGGVGSKRKREDEGEEGNKRRKLAKNATFHADLEKQLDVLQKAIGMHDFKNKGKFPPDLKPVLLDTAILAITIGDYGDNLFNHLPKIFPYNRFTMLKLTKRLVYKDHIRMIHERQGRLLDILRTMVDEGMDAAKTEHERAMAVWEERRARKKWEGEQANAQNPNAMEGVESTVQHPPSQTQVTEKEGDADKEEEGGEGGDDGDKDKPPTTRYRLNETMRGYLWALVQLSNDICTLTNDKNHLENSKEVVSEQGQRKELYKRVLQAFPDAWMNTGTISREVSMMKKKMETTTAPKTEDAAAAGTSTHPNPNAGTSTPNATAGGAAVTNVASGGAKVASS